jgi:phosphate acetyltransferase
MQAMEYIENRTFDEIRVGDTATLVRTLRPEDIQLFAIMSGDVNPAHVDPEYAKSGLFREVIAHGMWGGALISTVLGTQFPGPGTIYIDQTLHFSRPVGIGDTITVTLTATRKFDHNHHILFDCVCTNQDGQTVIRGTAEVLAPTEKIKRPRIELPEVTIVDREARYQHLLDRTRGLAPIPMAVAHPCDKESLLGVVEATQAGLIVPTLIGPESEDARRGRAAGHRPRRRDAGRRRAQPRRRRARRGAGARGQGRGADEGLAAHRRADERGGRHQRPAHGAAHQPRLPRRRADLPEAAADHRRRHQHRADLECKADIVQNAIDLALVLGIPEPKVAILAAVETVTPKMRATLDAAALCKMADRGQIAGGVLDGPLAFDNAISIVAAKTKGILSAVAGRADILVVPDLESGNMLAKQLEYLAEALMTGVVVGARVPIVLTSRADTAETRAASCAIALLMAHAKRKQSQAK